MFQTILVPVDGSATANLGLDEAIQLASDQKATLCLLHVVEEYALAQGLDVPVYVEGLSEAMRDAGKKVLAKSVARAEKRGVKVRPLLIETMGRSVSDLILAQAKKCRADLIVLGTHGRRGLARMVMGSDAEGVVRASPVPVMLVRTRSRARRTAAAQAEGN
jgi:nucleotide-binding universal stress UspA family protein